MVPHPTAALLLLILPVSVVSLYGDCPPGATEQLIFKKCYKYYNTPQTFLDAEHTCNSIGGHLVAIENAFENSYVAGIGDTSNFWIGANTLLTGTWSWTANTSMDYTNWAKGQPVKSSSCGILNGQTTQWIGGACYSLLPFLCTSVPGVPLPSPTTYPTGVPPSSTVPPPVPPSSAVPPPACHDATCSPGYRLFLGNCQCYKYFNVTKSFEDSSSTCTRNGGFLASITSAELNRFLADLPGIDCWGAQCPYIGLFCTASYTPTRCLWADGYPLGNYTNFFYDWKQQSVPPPYTSLYTLVASPPNLVESGYWEPSGNDNRTFICQKREALKCSLKWVFSASTRMSSSMSTPLKMDKPKQITQTEKNRSNAH